MAMRVSTISYLYVKCRTPPSSHTSMPDVTVSTNPNLLNTYNYKSGVRQKLTRRRYLFKFKPRTCKNDREASTRVEPVAVMINSQN